MTFFIDLVIPEICLVWDRSQLDYKERGIFEGDHKPSSVIPIPPFRGSREDGHLSRALIAQGLKRPNPPCFHPTNRADLNGLFLSRLWNGRRRPFAGRETGPIWSCSGWGLPGYPDRSGYGGLLPRLFTLIPTFVGTVCFCGTFLVPVKSASRFFTETVRVTDHPALRSSDFPPLLISPFTGSQEKRPSVPPSTLPLS